MQQGVQQCWEFLVHNVTSVYTGLQYQGAINSVLKKTNKQKAKDVFSVSDTGGWERKIRVPPIKSQTYDLVTIQPDALPLSYRPNDE